MIRAFAVLLAILTLITASPAHAGPLAPLVPIVIGAVVKSAIVKIALTLAATVALSMLNKAKKARSPGIMIEQTLTGGTNPRTIIFGLYCTSGSEVTPAMSYASLKKTPYSRLVKIIALADVPTDGISRVILNGEYVPLTPLGGNRYAIGGKYANHAWVTFHDGRQITADATLVANFSSYPNRPWTNNRIGRGVTYAWFEFLYNTEIFKAEPQFRIELRGMRLYDPRKDDTIGGVGSHRYNNPSTWEFTGNPIVMVYNIMRGIDLQDGTRWGGECSADDLPLANWAAAMNVCDELVGTTSGNEPRYRAGYEFSLNEEPAEVVEELLKGASAQIVESAGVYKVRVGPPALPVMFITDDDFIITKEQELDPFPGIGQSKNTINAVFPHPDELWQQHDAPQLQNPDYVTRDEGMELVADLQFPAVPYPVQVQRIMRAWLDDDQRWRRHTGTLSHRAFALEPLDTISWTSTRNGYVDKLFEIGLVNVNLYTLLVNVAVREVDPSDYDWDSGDELADPVSPGSWELPEAQAVEDFAVEAYSVKDDDSDERRPAIRCTWDIEAATDAMAIRIEVRVAVTMEAVTAITVANVGDGVQIISEGILPATSYEVRARYLVERATLWTVWHGVTTGNILLGSKDFDFDELVEGLGSSIVIPQITNPAYNSILQQIKDVAFNDIAERRQNLLQIDLFKNIYQNVAAIYSESVTRLTADEAFTQQLNVQISRIDTNESSILNESITRANADTVLASDISDISARLNNFGGSGVTAEVRLTQVDQARIDGDAALGIRIDTVEVDVDDNTAAINAEAIARADADSAIAANVTTVTARLDNAGGSGVTVEQAFVAQADDITGLQGQYTLRINANNRVSGFGLAVDGSGESEFAILADRFLVTDPANNSVTGYPFQVVGGAVYIRKAFIQTITADQITTGEFITTSAQLADAIISTAKIGDLQVDTIKIANNALTVPYLATAPGGGFTPLSGEVTLVETPFIDIGSPGQQATCLISYFSTAHTSSLAGYGGDAACDFKMYIDKNDGSGWVFIGSQSIGFDVASGTGYFRMPVSMVISEDAIETAKFRVTGQCVTGPNGAAATGIWVINHNLSIQGMKK